MTTMFTKWLFITLVALSAVQCIRAGDERKVRNQSAIDKMIDGVVQAVEGAIAVLKPAMQDAIAQLKKAAEELVASAKQAIAAAVKNVQDQVAAIGDALNDCAKAEAETLKKIVQDSEDKLKACVDADVQAASAIVGDLTKLVGEALGKVKEATESLKACAQKPIIEEAVCIIREQGLVASKVAKIVSAVSAKVLAGAAEIGKLQVNLTKCIGSELAQAKQSVAQVADNIKKCMEN